MAYKVHYELDADEVEKEQRRATLMVPDLTDVPYHRRLGDP